MPSSRPQNSCRLFGNSHASSNILEKIKSWSSVPWSGWKPPHESKVPLTVPRLRLRSMSILKLDHTLWTQSLKRGTTTTPVSQSRGTVSDCNTMLQRCVSYDSTTTEPEPWQTTSVTLLPVLLYYKKPCQWDWGDSLCVRSTVLCWGQHPHYSPILIIDSVEGNCFPLTVCQANRKASSMASLLPYQSFALATVRAALWLACWYSCSMYSKPVSVTRDQTPTSFIFCLIYDCCVVECTIRQVLYPLYECRKS